jgi:hypothetical protein
MPEGTYHSRGAAEWNIEQLRVVYFNITMHEALIARATSRRAREACIFFIHQNASFAVTVP